MSKLGLVFAGGGGKGAYEIGVWKALKEYDVDNNISAMSGTSVGGLNGALFTKGDFEQAVKVWEEMSPEKILQINHDKVISLLAKFNLPATIVTAIGKKLGFLKSEGIFSQKGLESIIRDSLQDGDLKDKIPFYICATDVTSKIAWKPLYKKLNDLNFKDIVQYLLATSAIPVAFPTTIVEDKELLDGFLTDNTPIKPLIEVEGCDKIIVVLLGRSETITQEKLKYPNVSFWEIVPTGNTKEELGSLDFKSVTASSLIEMGYSDTIEILKNLYEFMLIEQEYIEKGEILRIQNDGFKKQISNNSLLRREYKQLKNRYEDMNSLQYLISHPKLTKELTIQVEDNAPTLENIKQELEVTLDKDEMELIDINLDKVLEDMGNNSKEISKFAFDAVTSLASTTGKINYQINQGRFSRFIGTITGSDYKLQADINHNFSKSIYANTQMIKKLAQRNNLTLDMCISLGNKVNYLAQNQNLLQLQNNEQFKMLDGLKGAIFTLTDVTRTAIQNNTDRIEKLEYGQKLLNWGYHLQGSIKGLNPYESIVKIVLEYHDIVKNSNEESANNFLYSSLVNVGLDNITINPSAFIEYVIDNNTLFEKTKFLPLPQSYEVYAPVFASVSKVYEKNGNVKFNDIVSHLEDNYNLNLDSDIKGVDFAFELLSGLKIGAEIKESLPLSKTKMINRLDNLSHILKDDNIHIFNKDIESLKKKIDDFKVIIPVIGKFSSGKSKLLNTYITIDDKLFEVDTNPTTAIASEILYGQNNSVQLYDKDDKVVEISLEDIKNRDTKDIIYLKYFLNYPKLKNREDLVLVDMPGFESSNLNHNNAINHYFNRGNHYILALNCETANDNSILKHIKEILSYGAKFSIIITKSDKKLPKDIDKIVKVVRQNIAKKYPNEDFFIGSTSSFHNDIQDFEKIIDTIYEDAPNIFHKRFKKEFDILLDDITRHYNKLLKAPNDLIEFDKKILSEKKLFDDEVSQLNAKIKEIKFKIISEGAMTFSNKIENVLNANISSLINSAKNNNLSNTIIELLRPSMNSIIKKISEDSLRAIEDESLNISSDINLSLSNIYIDTKLSFFESIKNFFFKTQDKEIRNEIRNSVIPTVINDMSNNISMELETLYENIKKSVDEKIEDKREKNQELEKEIKQQINLQTKDFEELQSKYEKSLKKIEKEV